MPKFIVTVEMNEVSVCNIEVEAPDEETAENRAIREAKKDYRLNQAGELKLPWEVLDRETEFFAEEIDAVDEKPAKKPKQIQRKSRVKKSDDKAPRLTTAQVIQFPGAIVKAE